MYTANRLNYSHNIGPEDVARGLCNGQYNVDSIITQCWIPKLVATFPQHRINVGNPRLTKHAANIESMLGALFDDVDFPTLRV
jgi:hypothetical protein